VLKFNKKILKRSWDNIKKEKFLSFSNVLIMVITFLILGLFIILITISQTAIRYLESQAQVTVFFKDDFPEANILELRDRYVDDKRLASINYVSKEDAFRIFSEINKDEPVLLESISASILPASLEIKARNIKDLSPISAEFSTVDGIEDIRFFKDVIDKFKFWSNVLYIGGFTLLGILTFVSYSVILYTLKSTINAKGIELSILKLVGASDTYVKNPFVYQGMAFGLIASGIAGLLIVILSIIAVSTGLLKGGVLFGLVYGLTLNPIVYALILCILLMAFGGFLGYFGSLTAIKKYLKY